MKINHSPVKYSSIVEIGEKVSVLEKDTNETYLKLHRGVMDVDLIDLNSFMTEFDYNQKSIQQYGGNDGDVKFIEVIKDTQHSGISVAVPHDVFKQYFDKIKLN